MSSVPRQAHGVDLVVAELDYRRLLQRWYPSAWVEANGDVVVGTLLDVAEHRGTVTLTPSARGALVAHGVLAHAGGVLHPEVRERVASISVGVITGYAAVLTATSVVPSPWMGRSQPAHLASLLPFLTVWLVAAAVALTPRRRPRGVTLLAAALVTVATCGAWWTDSPFGFARDVGSWWSVVGYFGPAIVANTVLLAGSGALSLLGRARLRLVAVTALTVAAAVVLLLVIATSGVQLYEPDLFWAADWAHLNLPTAFLGLVVLDAVVVLALLGRHHRSTALALAIATTPWIAACIAELVIDPSIGIPT